MEIEYGYNDEDAKAFLRYQAALMPTSSTSPRGAKFQIWLWWLIAVCLLVLVVLAYVQQAVRGYSIIQPFPYLVPGLLVLLPILLFRRRMHGWLVRWDEIRLARKLKQLGAQRLRAAPDGLRSAEVLTAWTAIGKIGVTADHAFIHLGANAAIMVPRHAFTEEHGFEAFIEAVQAYHRSASALDNDLHPPE